MFGLSLLGAFEITLPSGLLTKMDQASQPGGIFGTLLMGLTFSLHRSPALDRSSVLCWPDRCSAAASSRCSA